MMTARISVTMWKPMRNHVEAHAMHIPDLGVEGGLATSMGTLEVYL